MHRCQDGVIFTVTCGVTWPLLVHQRIEFLLGWSITWLWPGNSPLFSKEPVVHMMLFLAMSSLWSPADCWKHVPGPPGFPHQWSSCARRNARGLDGSTILPCQDQDPSMMFVWNRRFLWRRLTFLWLFFFLLLKQATVCYRLLHSTDLAPGKCRRGWRSQVILQASAVVRGFHHGIFGYQEIGQFWCNKCTATCHGLDHFGMAQLYQGATLLGCSPWVHVCWWILQAWFDMSCGICAAHFAIVQWTVSRWSFFEITPVSAIVPQQGFPW